MTTPDMPDFDESPTTQLDANGVLMAANAVLEMKIRENVRLERISKYMRGHHEPPYTPRGASTEYRWLTKRARDNFLPLICSVIAQNLHVDGWRPSGAETVDTNWDVTADPGWTAWQANRMVSRQHAVHRSVVKYGVAYNLVLPGRIAQADPTTGDLIDVSMPVITSHSPRRMTALYADEMTDEWPMLAMSERTVNDPTAPGKARRVVTLYDDTNRYILVSANSRVQSKLVWPSADDPILAGRPAVASHNMGICPVTRFTYEADLDYDTDCVGEIEPLISLQDQVNFHTFNELLAEQFAAFKQRWVSGMAPADEEGREARPFRPGVDRVWNSEDPNTRFGEFSETNLSPISAAREDTIRHMSTISQVPPYHLLGSLVNLSADALSAARDGLDRKVEELKAVLTDPWRNTFRLASKASGDSTGWMDLHGRVIWRDTSARSFAATIDGLGKAAQMLGVPAHELWRRIPGVTAEDVAAWQESASRSSAMEQIDKVVEAALTGGAMAGGPPTAEQPYQINAAAGAQGLGHEPTTVPPGQVGGDGAQPPGNAATPPGAPGNAAADADTNGNPPTAPGQDAKPAPADSGTEVVHVPAHTRTRPKTPGGGSNG